VATRPRFELFSWASGPSWWTGTHSAEPIRTTDSTRRKRCCPPRGGRTPSSTRAGIEAPTSVGLETLMDRKDGVVDDRTSGVEALCRGNDVTRLRVTPNYRMTRPPSLPPTRGSRNGLRHCRRPWHACTSLVPLTSKGRALSRGDAWSATLTPTVHSRQILRQEASELLGEIGVAMRSGLIIEVIARTVHPYPTLSDAVMEAATPRFTSRIKRGRGGAGVDRERGRLASRGTVRHRRHRQRGGRRRNRTRCAVRT